MFLLLRFTIIRQTNTVLSSLSPASCSLSLCVASLSDIDSPLHPFKYLVLYHVIIRHIFLTKSAAS